MRNYTVVIEPDEDGYHGFVPSLPGCHTFGLTVDETLLNLNEAAALYIEVLLEDGEPLPVESLSFMVTHLSVPTSAREMAYA